MAGVQVELTNAGGSADALVYTGPGRLAGALLVSTNQASTDPCELVLRDGTDDTGTIIWRSKSVWSDCVERDWWPCYIEFQTGLFAELNNTGTQAGAWSVEYLPS